MLDMMLLLINLCAIMGVGRKPKCFKYTLPADYSDLPRNKFQPKGQEGQLYRGVKVPRCLKRMEAPANIDPATRMKLCWKTPTMSSTACGQYCIKKQWKTVGLWTGDEARNRLRGLKNGNGQDLEEMCSHLGDALYCDSCGSLVWDWKCHARVVWCKVQDLAVYSALSAAKLALEVRRI